MDINSTATKILISGHYAHDIFINRDGTPHHRLGGPPAFAAAILEACDAHYSVITKVGKDFKYNSEILQPPNIAPTQPTTTFVNDLRRPYSRCTIESVCEPIFPQDIQKTAMVACVCGMIGEVLPETIQKLRESTQILIGDVQGFLRVIGKDKSVTLQVLEKTVYYDVIKLLNYLKVNEKEKKYINVDIIRKYTTVIVTEGKKGCKLYTKDGSFSVPGRKIKVKDSIGAGDSFVAGFAYGLSQGYAEEEAAAFGNCCGSLTTEQIGVPKLKREVFDAYFKVIGPASQR